MWAAFRRHHRVPARAADHRQALALGPGHGQPFDQAHALIHRAPAQGPGLGQGRVHHRVVVGQSGGVAVGDGVAGRRDVGFVHHHRLGAVFDQLIKPPAGHHRFQVEQDYLGVLILHEIGQQVLFVDVELVAHAGEVGHAHPGLGQALHIGEPHSPALGHYGKGTPGRGLLQKREGRGHSGVGADHSDAVGPDETHVVGPGDAEQLPFQPDPLISQLAKTAGFHHHPLYALLAAGFQNAGHGGRRGEHRGQLRGFGQFADIPVYGLAPPFAALGAHQIQRSGEAVHQKIVHDIAAHIAFAGRHPDHDRRFGMEESAHGQPQQSDEKEFSLG